MASAIVYSLIHSCQCWTAGVLELVGGVLMILGLFTRSVAFVMSGFMAFAYFIAHSLRGLWTIANKWELAVLYYFVFLYFSAAGGRPWSVDHVRSNGRP